MYSLLMGVMIFGSGETHSQITDSTESIWLFNPGDTIKYTFDEVVVTGTRGPKKVIDIPYSVQRLSNLEFRYSKRIAINDVLSTVPGVFMQSRYGNHDVRISIRGFGSRSNSGIRGVRILLDGIPESEPDGQTRIEAIDFNSVGSIEVVKGNSSSLYTNAPGGVVNFINDINFYRSHTVNFNQFGSYGLRRNGFKTGIRTDNYGFLLTYSYHNYDGYRKHGSDYWHIINTVLETTPGDNTNLQILGYFVKGLIRLPGSLTKEEYEQDPFQAGQREVDRDTRRLSHKGRIGLRFKTQFGEDLNQDLELTGYGTIKYFERPSRTYRIINRYGLGASGRYLNIHSLFGLKNEFSIGGDLLYQTGPVETYDNIGGSKGDVLSSIVDNTIGNSGFFFSNYLHLTDQAALLITGRYDKVYFDLKNRILESQNDARTFEDFTPKAAFNYKLTPAIAAYTSFGLSFDSPAGNELDNFPTSSTPGKLLNPDLQPQKSLNFEIGIKGNIKQPHSAFFNDITFEATFFNSVIDDEIVPFEVYGEVFFRNSAQTNRRGLEIGWNTKVTDRLTFLTAYTFSDFSYDEYSALSISIDTTGNIATTEQDYTGNRVPSVPEHNLTTTLTYEQPFSKNVYGFLKGTYRFISGLYVDDANSDQTDGYNTLDLMAGFDLKYDRWNILVSGGVNNVFDLRYVGFVNINSSDGRYYETGEPRIFFATCNIAYTF